MPIHFPVSPKSALILPVFVNTCLGESRAGAALDLGARLSIESDHPRSKIDDTGECKADAREEDGEVGWRDDLGTWPR